MKCNTLAKACAILLFATVSFAASVGDSPCHTAIAQYRATGQTQAVQEHCSPEVQTAILGTVTQAPAKMTCGQAIEGFRRDQISATELSKFCPANVVAEIGGTQQQWQPQTAVVTPTPRQTNQQLTGVPSVSVNGQMLALEREDIRSALVATNHRDPKQALQDYAVQSAIWSGTQRVAYGIGGLSGVRGAATLGGLLGGAILGKKVTERDNPGFEYSVLTGRTSSRQVPAGSVLVTVPSAYQGLTLVRLHSTDKGRAISAQPVGINSKGEAHETGAEQRLAINVTNPVTVAPGEHFALIGTGDVAYTFSVY